MKKTLLGLMLFWGFTSQAFSRCQTLFFYVNGTNSGLTKTLIAVNTSKSKHYSVNWDFGDGSKGTGIKTNHTFASEGKYMIIATCYDTTNSCRDTNYGYACILDNTVTITKITGLEFEYKCTSVAGRTYQWYFDDNTALALGNPVTHTFAKNGAYNGFVMIEDSATKCGITDSFNCIPNYAGVNELNSKNPLNIRIYPNPVNQELVFETTGQTDFIRYQILNLQGQMVAENTLNFTNGRAVEIEKIKYLQPGNYLIRIISDRSRSEIRNIKFTKIN